MTESTAVSAPRPKDIDEVRMRLARFFGEKNLRLWPEKGQSLKDQAVLDQALLDQIECGPETYKVIRDATKIGKEDLHKFLRYCRHKRDGEAPGTASSPAA